jgi:hypothetical protein
MPLLPSFRVSKDQREKYSSKTTGASESYLNQFNRYLASLAVDKKPGVAEYELSPEEPIITVIELIDKESNQRSAGDDWPQATSPSDTTESSSLSDIEKKLEAPLETSVTEISDEASSVCSSVGKRNSFRWGRKSQPRQMRVPATIGETVAPRCRLGDASIEGDFASIQYGTHNGRPACCIVVDFRLVFQDTSAIDWARIQFRFGSNSTESDDAQISKAFFPDELAGQCDTAQEILAVSPNVGLGVAGCKANFSGISKQQARVTRRCWRVQGTTEEHQGHYDTFCWRVFENPLSADSVPRHFRTGMIAYLPADYTFGAEHNTDFWVDISVEGTLRGLRSRHKKVKGRRWFELGPTLQDYDRVFDKMALKSVIQDVNNSIPDLGHAEKITEGPLPSFPALPAPAAASLDVPAKANVKETPSQTNETGYGAETSYEKFEVEENLVQMPGTNEDEARAPPC